MKKYLHICSFIASLIVTLILFSCGIGGLGNQPPENVTLMASADGSTIIRQYSVFYVTSSIQRGGSTQRFGSTTNYLELYNGMTGELISAKTYSIKGNCQLLKVTTTHAWLQYYNREKNKQEILVVNIPQFSKAYDEAELVKINNGLIFNTNYTYYNPPSIGGVLLQADDARLYAVDETNGKATIVPDTIKTRMINRRFLQMGNIQLADRWLSFNGSQRKKLIAKMNDRKSGVADISSETDFINPYFVGYYDPIISQELPLTMNNGFLIVSKTKDNNKFEFQFTSIDSSTLKTNWQTILNNDKGETNENDLLDIKLHGNGLLLITKKSMSLLDTKTGQWKWDKNFQ